jgi:NAD(P)-dependent dehydrogenase (short-subunit alcohol dehydrogenase family)
MKDFDGKVVVVTGAASGIGREIARAFARRGARLAICDINAVGLEVVRQDLAAGNSTIYSQVSDVSVASQVKDFCDAVYAEMGRVDILCNNAGVALSGLVQNFSLEDWEWQFGPNLWGVIHGCHFFYPRMIEQGGGGHIVNTASGAGLFPVPFFAAYSTTKFGVVGLSETLRGEAAMHGIGVSVLCPGAVSSTNFARNARVAVRVKGSSAEEQKKAWHQTWNRIMKMRNYSPAKVAAAVVKGVEKNKPIIRVGSDTFIGDFLIRSSRRLYLVGLERTYRLLKRYL